MKICLLSLVASSALLHAGFDARHWRSRLTLTATEPARVYTMPLPAEFYRAAQPGFEDLRLIHDGIEVPYVVETLTGAAEAQELRPRILDRAIVPKAGLQLSLDLGRPLLHNRLRIATELKNFRTKVRVETSADGQKWAVARADGTVFDFTESGRSVAVLDVSYPPSTRRFVRATFFGWTDTSAVSDAWLMHYTERPTSWQALGAANFRRSEKEKASLLEMDLGATPPILGRLRFETGEEWFHRACEVEASDDGEQWSMVAQGALYRLPEGSSDAIQFPEKRQRYWRVRIFNGDDKLVTVRTVFLEAVERRMKFVSTSVGEYQLYCGNPDARRPVYDLAMILAQSGAAASVVQNAGPLQDNPLFQPPPPLRPPWSERHRAVLYGIVAAAILGMGWITVRLLIKVPRADSGSHSA